MITNYRNNYLNPVVNQIDQTNRKKNVNYNALQRAISQDSALPEKINMTELDLTKELMNKIMKKYID